MFKLIKNSEYQNMVQKVAETEERESAYKKQINGLVSENTSLREQLGCMVNEVQKLNQAREAQPFAELRKLHILFGKPLACEHCMFEKFNCQKLHFANRTLCVCAKEDAHSFLVK